MENFYNEHDKLFVAVDCIVFGFDEGELRVLMGKRKMNPGRGVWSLYGGFVGENESVDDAAKRVLYGLTGLKDLYMKLVGAFGDVGRDPGNRVVSIAYYSMINVADYDQAQQDGAQGASHDAGEDFARADRLQSSARTIHPLATPEGLRGRER